MSDRNVLPCILTGIGTIFVTVGVLWYYGYLHFAKPQDALLLADFTMLKSLPGEDVKLSLEPAKQVAQCIDGVLVLFDTEQKGLSGVLVDNRKHAVRCAGQEVALAEQAGAASVAFPAISCGIYGYPLEQAAAIAVEEVCRQRPAHSSLEEIVLVAFDSSMAERYQRLLGERPVAR